MNIAVQVILFICCSVYLLDRGFSTWIWVIVGLAVLAVLTLGTVCLCLPRVETKP